VRPGRYQLPDRLRYPHMGEEDRQIWDAWAGRADPDALGVDYDVRVGPGIPAPESASATMAADWEDLTQLRIDAVVYYARRTVLVEIKPRLLVAGIGQLLAYGYWYAREVQDVGALELLYLVERTSSQLEAVCRAYRIHVERLNRTAPPVSAGP
jgi:hypothetical protein